MITPEQILSDFAPFLSPTLAALLGFIGVWFCNWFFLRRKPGRGREHALLRQGLVIGITGATLLIIFLQFPITPDTRAQMLSLFGIVTTGVIALSSTTFVSNAMAGLMLRLVRNFRTGDFIRISDEFGRVTERGILHTEIQTENRDLTTFPNLHLITNPVTVVRTSGTLINASVSLGYDVLQSDVKNALLAGAEKAGLAEAFVLVTDLGDFSVGYQVSGFLEDIKTLLSSRSHLKSCVLDTLHEAGIEIVSPNFMNQRVLKEGTFMIPETASRPIASTPEANAEEIMFDKADEAESVEMLNIRLKEIRAIIEAKQNDKQDVSNEQRIEQQLLRRIDSLDTDSQ